MAPDKLLEAPCRPSRDPLDIVIGSRTVARNDAPGQPAQHDTVFGRDEARHDCLWLANSQSCRKRCPNELACGHLRWLSGPPRNYGDASRAPRRPPRKARGGSIPGVFDRRATQRGGMHRRLNAAVITRRTTKGRPPVAAPRTRFGFNDRTWLPIDFLRSTGRVSAVGCDTRPAPRFAPRPASGTASPPGQAFG